MLTHLHIENFTIIETIDLELQQGLTTLTGETGAGKSILLGALGMVLGGRAEPSMVRPNAVRCEVSACFDLSANHIAQQSLAEQDLLDNDDECLLRRSISSEGRSRAFINGKPCTQKQLKAIGQQLISIHGQHENQTLVKKEQQRQLLDAFADHQTLCDKLAEHYQAWRGIQNEFDSLTALNQNESTRSDFLQFQVDELDQLALGDDELNALTSEHKTLANAETIIQTLQAAVQAMAGDEQGSIMDQLHTINHKLDSIGKLLPIDSTQQAFNEAILQLQEANHDLKHQLAKLDVDPKRLQWVEQRLSQIQDMARKHRIKPEALPTLQLKLQQELDQLTRYDEILAALQTKIDTLAKHYAANAKKLTASRTRACNQLNALISADMQTLNMRGGEFEARLVSRNDSTPHIHGNEQIEFWVRTNPGQTMQPLAKIASGGELSRIGLALQAATSHTQATATLIFDEVDTGIGGSTAAIVGRLLRQLSSHAQVLCITHLPQVAAQAQRHFQISKHTSRDSTKTEVKVLTEAARVDELARMLGGVTITPQTRAAAAELLAEA